MLGTINAIINNLLNNIFHAVWLFMLTTNPRFNKTKTALLAAFSVVIAEALSLFTILNFGVEGKAFTLLYIIGSLVYIIFYVFLMQKGRILKSLFIFFSYICVWSAVYVIVMIMTNYLFSGWEPSVWILRSLFNIALLFVYHYLFKSRFRKNQLLLEKPSGVLLLVSGMAYLLLPVLMIFYAFDSKENALSLAIIGFLLFFCAVVYILIFRFIRQMGREKSFEAIEAQNKFLRAAIRNAEEMELVASRARHDARHRDALLLDLARSGNTEEIVRLLAEYETGDETEGGKYSANGTVDAILRYYIRKARINGIDVETDITMNRETSVSDVDLIAIIGNMLENAINACMKVSEDRRINISVFHKGMKLVFVCKNTCCENIRFENGIPKRNIGEGNGIGATSIMMSAERYDGNTRFSAADGVFTCQVILNDNI